MLVHLRKVHGWPEIPSVSHWRGEIVSFQKDAAQRFAPSMRQRISLTSLYADAIEQLETAAYDGAAPQLWPAASPFTPNQLL